MDRLAKRRRGSERSPSPKGSKKKSERGGRNQLPSKRYPNIPVVERELDFEETPRCSNCGEEMKDSGLHECVETLTVIPKKYLIDRILKKKYRCGGCHSGMLRVPSAPRIVPGSSYSDEMVLGVALSKYCDLIPMERYPMMASGFLRDCRCEYLVSDVFSGYSKAVKDVNKYREERGLRKLISAYCSTHARRKFKDAEGNFPEETKRFRHSYKYIYRLNKESRGLSRDGVLRKRSEMDFYFKEMKRAAEKIKRSCSPHSALGEGVQDCLFHLITPYMV